MNWGPIGPWERYLTGPEELVEHTLFHQALQASPDLLSGNLKRFDNLGFGLARIHVLEQIPDLPFGEAHEPNLGLFLRDLKFIGDRGFRLGSIHAFEQLPDLGEQLAGEELPSKSVRRRAMWSGRPFPGARTRTKGS